MKVRSLVRASLAQFRVNVIRTFLALLGIIFGVSSVIAMIAIGEGAQREILDSINAMGADLVHIQEGDIEKSQLSRVINDSLGLSERDLTALRAVIPMEGRDTAAFAKCRVKTTSLPMQANALNVFAVTDRFLPVNRLTIVAGREFSPSDFVARASVAVVSSKLAEGLYVTSEAAIGKDLCLNMAWFRIIGVFDRTVPNAGRRNEGKSAQATPASSTSPDSGRRRGLPKDYGIFDQSIFLPLSTYQEKVASEKIYSPLDKIILKARDLSETNTLKAVAERVLNVTHNGVKDYKIISPQELLDQRQSTQEIFNIVLLSIASISLLVGGIGIMNIMLANVFERKVEIGIRRALGAKKRHIIFQFLFESVLICLIGGILGVLLGLGIGVGIMHFTKIPVGFSLKSIVISFAISFSVGVIFGIMPAREAASLNPVEALHDE
ncbi:MAG: ABC transporter permease [Candidatus Ozemobacteraceae bacterium]